MRAKCRPDRMVCAKIRFPFSRRCCSRDQVRLLCTDGTYTCILLCFPRARAYTSIVLYGGNERQKMRRLLAAKSLMFQVSNCDFAAEIVCHPPP